MKRFLAIPPQGFFLGLSLLLLSVFSLSLASTSNAGAVSQYDTLIKTTDEILLQFEPNSYCSNNRQQNITDNWDSVFSTNDGVFPGTDNYFYWPSGYNEAKASWDNKTNWGVINHERYNTNMYARKEVTIWWSEQSVTGTFGTFNHPNGFDVLYFEGNPNIKTVRLVIDSGLQYGSGKCRVAVHSQAQYNQNNYWIISENTPNDAIFFAYMNSIAYPSGYQGEVIPDTGYSPPTVVDYVPDFYASQSKDWKALIHDQNFNTTDMTYPFLCTEDLAPVLHYEIWQRNDGTESMLTSGYHNATAQVEYQFPKENSDRNYRVVGWYDCGQHPEIQFSDSSYFDFTITASGGLATATECSSEILCQLDVPTYGFTEVILSPLAFVSKIPQSTCSPLTLPMPHGIQNISLPCMTPIYSQYFGPILLMFQTILTGLFAYYVSIRIFGNIKSLTNPRDDQVETVKL